MHTRTRTHARTGVQMQGGELWLCCREYAFLTSHAETLVAMLLPDTGLSAFGWKLWPLPFFHWGPSRCSSFRLPSLCLCAYLSNCSASSSLWAWSLFRRRLKSFSLCLLLSYLVHTHALVMPDFTGFPSSPLLIILYEAASVQMTGWFLSPRWTLASVDVLCLECQAAPAHLRHHTDSARASPGDASLSQSTDIRVPAVKWALGPTPGLSKTGLLPNRSSKPGRREE